MDNTNIRFSDDVNYDSSREHIVFYAYVGKKGIRCAISQQDLNDHYHTEDTKENALEHYQNHKDYFHGVANKIISDERFKENDEVFITSNNIR